MILKTQSSCFSCLSIAVVSFWPHPMHSSRYRRSSAVCLSVCPSVDHVRENCKNTEPIAVWGTDSYEYKEPRIRRGQYQTNPSAVVRGDKSTMRLFDKLLRTLVIGYMPFVTPHQQRQSIEVRKFR